MHGIDLYNNSEIILQRKESIIYKVFILIVILFLLIFLLLIALYRYDRISKIKGLVKNNKISLTISENNLKLLNSNDILVNEKRYKVNIESISDAIYDSNYNAYYDVILNIDFNDDILIENNILDINILLGKTTLYQQIKEEIEEGLQQ